MKGEGNSTASEIVIRSVLAAIFIGWRRELNVYKIVNWSSEIGCRVKSIEHNETVSSETVRMKCMGVCALVLKRDLINKHTHTPIK